MHIRCYALMIASAASLPSIPSAHPLRSERAMHTEVILYVRVRYVANSFRFRCCGVFWFLFSGGGGGGGCRF
ncbi:hypothetical protein F4782DRAFT_475406, partial [Xylaria castorea]